MRTPRVFPSSFRTLATAAKLALAASLAMSPSCVIDGNVAGAPSTVDEAHVPGPVDTHSPSGAAPAAYQRMSSRPSPE